MRIHQRDHQDRLGAAEGSTPTPDSFARFLVLGR
jgi:hypothetical protein